MYIFHIKNEGPQLDILVTRALLGLSALACILFGNQPYRLLDYLLAIVLLVAAVLIRKLIHDHKISRAVILSVAAVLLFVSTGSFFFAAILLVYGLLVKFFYPKNTVEVSEEGVRFHKVLGNSLNSWEDLHHVVLKDNLLSLDFKNNKLLQLTTDPGKSNIDEREFNQFCTRFLGTGFTA